MKLFKNKVNIILALVLIILIGVGVILGMKFFAKPNVVVADFTNMTEQEVMAWAKEKEVEEFFEYEHEFDNDIEKDKVIYQSIKEGEELTSKILIIISDGPDTSEYIVIPVDSLKTVQEFNEWLSKNELTNVSYDYDNQSELAEGTIISIIPDKAKKDDLVVVKIASNKNIDVPDFSYMSDKEISAWAKENNVKINIVYEASNLSKDSFVKQSVKAGDKVAANSTINITLSSGKNTTDNNTAYIDPYEYLGEKEEKFVSALKELGFTNVVKKEEVYSDKYDKGTICYYLPDGNQKLDTKIEYKVSKGKKSDAETKTAYIDETKYLGEKEEKFVSALKELGFTNIVKIDEVYSDKYDKGTICYYLPDGEQKLDTKIEYKVSKGKKSGTDTKTAYIDPNMYLGSEENLFKAYLAYLGFTNVVKIDEVYSDNYKKGTICYYLPDGELSLDTKIEYKVSKGKKPEEPTISKATILEFETMESYYSKTTYNDTKNAIANYFTNAGFTNVTYVGVTSSESVGTLVSIEVNGSTNYSSGTQYSTDTPIKVSICNVQK